MAMNHLIGSNFIKVSKLDSIIDYPSANDESVFKKVHIHVFHGENLFSKFMFRDGKYDKFNTTGVDKQQIKYYTLSLALESKFLSSPQMLEFLKIVLQPKE